LKKVKKSFEMAKKKSTVDKGKKKGRRSVNLFVVPRN